MTGPAGVSERSLLDFADQGLFLALRATGQESVAQIVWVYEHPVDVERLRRFHRNLGYGLLGRRIERSVLPFGRHHWVWSPGPSAPFEIAERPRPRAELGDWVDERSQLSADPEFGPGWHLGAARFDDGSTAVSLVASHCLVDGMGLMQTVIHAVDDTPRTLPLPPPAAQGRVRAAAAEFRESVRGIPAAAKALAIALRLAVRNRPAEPRDKSRELAVRPGSRGPAEEVLAPSLVAYVDIAQWDARAKELGGNSHSLVAGFAAKLAEHHGRVRSDDGLVKLMIPINERNEDDTRANAVTMGYARLNPVPVTSDLGDARLVIREALASVREQPDESLQALPLIPFVPKRAVAGGADAMFGFAADLPVSASNLGDIDPRVLRADGSAADYFFIRGVDGRVSRDVLERRRGFLTVICARAAGRVALPVIAYRPGAANSKAELRETVTRTLGEFGLTASVE